MTGTDVLNLVPEEARPLATAYFKGLADAFEIFKKKEQEAKEEEAKEEEQ